MWIWYDEWPYRQSERTKKKKKYLEKLLESSVADFVNTSPNKNGAAITASLFLSKFIKKILN